MSRGQSIFGRFVAVMMRILLAILKDGDGNVFLRLADVRHMSKHVVYCTSGSDLQQMSNKMMSLHDMRH
jgi:hypothetical protein